eukprot:1486872-Rhodomonas_salina.1
MAYQALLCPVRLSHGRSSAKALAENPDDSTGSEVCRESDTRNRLLLAKPVLEMLLEMRVQFLVFHSAVFIVAVRCALLTSAMRLQGDPSPLLPPQLRQRLGRLTPTRRCAAPRRPRHREIKYNKHPPSHILRANGSSVVIMGMFVLPLFDQLGMLAGWWPEGEVPGEKTALSEGAIPGGGRYDAEVVGP